MARQTKTEEGRQDWPVIGQRPVLAKTHVAYWRDRVRKVKSTSGADSPNYSARIFYKGRRMRFPLRTANKEQAAAKAARIYSMLIQEGWEATLVEFKPEAQNPDEGSQTTVGEFLRVASKHSTARPQSVESYKRALRKIVADIFEIPKGRKHDTRNPEGNSTWRERVEVIPLADLTPALIQNWKNQRLASSTSDASSKRHAIVTVNSLIRNAKALFSKRFLPFVREEIELPDPLPFEGVTLERTPSLRYHSKIDAESLMKAARKTLRKDHPEPYKCFLLALVFGLRASEIDWLLWDAFDFEKRTLRIENTAYHRLKSEDSAGEIDLSSTIAQVFQECAESSSGEFVIESDGSQNRTPGSGSYRCEGHFNTLKSWLRKNGVKDSKPIHALRKECGAVVASESGIWAASRYLRHSDIRITSAFYTDKKQTVVPKFAR